MDQDNRIRALEEKLSNMMGWRRFRRSLITLVFAAGIPMAIYAITKQHTFTSGTLAKAEEINQNFDDLIGAINKAIPAGTMLAFGDIIAPSGFLLCDGSEASRSNYSDLFATIGTSFGEGDGTTTFHLPDFRGRFIRGRDGGAGLDSDSAGRTAMNTGGNAGDNVGSVQSDMVEDHTHNHRHSHGGADGVFASTGNFTSGNVNVGTSYSNYDATIPTTGTHGSETRPKNAYVNFIIKY